VSTAILLALARAAGAEPTPIDVGRSAANVGRTAGVSATGALDDALASLGPGFVVTDNPRGVLVRTDPVDPGLGVLLYIPSERHPPSPTVRNAFARETDKGAAAARAAVEGDWVLAMRLNTEVVERAMGYTYEPLRNRLRELGAVASGVSGLGPTLAAVAPRERLAELARGLPTDDAERRMVPFAGPDLRRGAGP